MRKSDRLMKRRLFMAGDIEKTRSSIMRNSVSILPGWKNTWKKSKFYLYKGNNKSLCFIVIIMTKCPQVIKRFFVKYQVGCYLYWNWSFVDCYNNRYNRFSIKFYRFCIGICCGIGAADLCRSKI